MENLTDKEKLEKAEDGMNFIHGFLAMLKNSCLLVDGLENLDPEWLLSVTNEAGSKLVGIDIALNILKPERG